MKDELEKSGVSVIKEYSKYRNDCIKNNIPLKCYEEFVRDTYLDKLYNKHTKEQYGDNNADEADESEFKINY